MKAKALAILVLLVLTVKTASWPGNSDKASNKEVLT